MEMSYILTQSFKSISAVWLDQNNNEALQKERFQAQMSCHGSVSTKENEGELLHLDAITLVDRLSPQSTLPKLAQLPSY